MAEKGIYCLILKTGGAVLDVGALGGEVTFPAGYYVYVGSALGPGGACTGAAPYPGLPKDNRAPATVAYRPPAY